MNGWTCIAQTHSHSKTYVDHYEFTNCTGGWGIRNEIEGLSFLGKHNNTLISRNKKPLHNSYLSEVLCTSAASCHNFLSAAYVRTAEAGWNHVLCSFSQLDSTRLDTKQVASTNDHLVWWTHAKLSYLWYFAGFLVGHAMFWLVSWLKVWDSWSSELHPSSAVAPSSEFWPPPVCLWWPLYLWSWKKHDR